MRVESDEGFVLLIAEDDKEIALLLPMQEALNRNPSLPAQLVDNLENGPEHRVINGILQIQIS